MEVPEVVVQRLPLYLRALKEFLDKGTSVVSSQQLGVALHMTPAQIRKDLSYFGRFGKQGKGYNAQYLLNELKQILGLDRDWQVSLIGVGRLGRAIIGYPGFEPQGFKIVAAFDANPRQVGQVIGGMMVQPIADMEETLRSKKIAIAIVAVPANEAQDVINNLVRCGVKAVLNYAPMNVEVPKDVKVQNIDPVLALQSMTYYLRSRDTAAAKGSSNSKAS